MGWVAYLCNIHIFWIMNQSKENSAFWADEYLKGWVYRSSYWQRENTNVFFPKVWLEVKQNANCIIHFHSCILYLLIWLFFVASLCPFCSKVKYGTGQEFCKMVSFLCHLSNNQKYFWNFYFTIYVSFKTSLFQSPGSTNWHGVVSPVPADTDLVYNLLSSMLYLTGLVPGLRYSTCFVSF